MGDNNSLHIDAMLTYYGITWDDGGDINVATGDINGIFNSGRPVTFAYQYDKQPDIALYYDGTDVWAHVAWLTSYGGGGLYNYLYLEDSKISDLASGTFTGSNHFDDQPTNTANHGDFYFPRIDCPNSSYTAYDDWTIVLMESDYNWTTPAYFYYIVGYNKDQNNITGPTIYNDGFGSNFGTDITSLINEFPVVTYDDSYNPGITDNGIWVGWNVIGLTGGSVSASYPLVAKCAEDGKPDYTNTADFWEVPYYFKLLSSDASTSLELSGRSTNAQLLISFWGGTYFGFNVDDIYTKTVPISSSTLKVNGDVTAQSSFNQQNVLQLLNNSSSLVLLTLYDLSGKLVFNGYKNANELKNDLIQQYQNRPLSVYLAHLITDDGVLNITHKINLGY